MDPLKVAFNAMESVFNLYLFVTLKTKIDVLHL